MSKKFLAAVLLSASLGALAHGADFTPDKNFPTNDQAKDLLAEGVKQYRSGRYPQAAAAFRAALKLDPDNHLMFDFYQAAGDALLVKMEQYDELGDVLKDVLRRARIYQKEMRRSPEYIELLISKLEKSDEERVVATRELVAVGPLAVPALLARINDNRQDELRANARIALTQMGYRAVLALSEALKASDQRQVVTAAAILADIGDPRPLPKLKQLLDSKTTDDTTKRVVTNSIEAIRKASRLTEVASADQLYFTEALRYFRGPDLVRDEQVANESLVWRWDDTAKKLSYVKVPRYAWNELIAEQLLFDGATAYPQFSGYYPLLAADLAAQAVETELRARLAKENTIPLDQQSADEQMDAIAVRVQALAEVGNRVRLVGGPNLYRAVQQAIVSERTDVAAYLLRELEDPVLARADVLLPTKAEGLSPEKAGTVLVAALDHNDKIIRYQAAITLATLDPALEFFNADKVVPILADAVSEWGARVALVIDQDYRQRNTAREQLHSKGLLAYTAIDGSEALQRLEEAPIKDVIILAGDLLPSLRDEHGALIKVPEQQADTLVAKLKEDWRAKSTPIFISLPEDADLANKLQKAFDGKVAGFIKKPFNADDMNGKIELALKDAQLPNVNREVAEDIALRAALALAKPNPARTQFDLSRAAEKLAATLEARVDGLRIASAEALAVAARGKQGDSVKALITKVTDLYGAQDASLKPAVRAAFLDAIGQLNPTHEASVAILSKALAFADQGNPAGALAVRTAAATAIGSGVATTPELLLRYQTEQRLDVRGAGADKPAADATTDAAKPAPAAEAAPAADAQPATEPAAAPK